LIIVDPQRNTWEYPKAIFDQMEADTASIHAISIYTHKFLHKKCFEAYEKWGVFGNWQLLPDTIRTRLEKEMKFFLTKVSSIISKSLRAMSDAY